MSLITILVSASVQKIVIFSIFVLSEWYPSSYLPDLVQNTDFTEAMTTGTLVGIIQN